MIPPWFETRKRREPRRSARTEAGCIGYWPHAQALPIIRSIVAQCVIDPSPVGRPRSTDGAYGGSRTGRALPRRPRLLPRTPRRDSRAPEPRDGSPSDGDLYRVRRAPNPSGLVEPRLLAARPQETTAPGYVSATGRSSRVVTSTPPCGRGMKLNYFRYLRGGVFRGNRRFLDV